MLIEERIKHFYNKLIALQLRIHLKLGLKDMETDYTRLVRLKVNGKHEWK